jgi:hypothetical protein
LDTEIETLLDVAWEEYVLIWLLEDDRYVWILGKIEYDVNPVEINWELLCESGRFDWVPETVFTVVCAYGNDVGRLVELSLWLPGSVCAGPVWLPAVWLGGVSLDSITVSKLLAWDVDDIVPGCIWLLESCDDGTTPLWLPEIK